MGGPARQCAAATASGMGAVGEGACEGERPGKERQAQLGGRGSETRDEGRRHRAGDTHRDAGQERRSPRCRGPQPARGTVDREVAGMWKSDHMFGHWGTIEHSSDDEQVF